MICIDIDELSPCLQDTLTGEYVNTEVIRIKRLSILNRFNSKNGWYVNWRELAENDEIYALVLEGTFSIQGLVAVRPDEDSQTAFIDWAVASPENNLQIVSERRYTGVGGHLLAIASDRSMEYGYGGAMSGFAADQKRMEHFVTRYGAEPICQLHPCQIFFDEESAQRIREVYTYEWADDET